MSSHRTPCFAASQRESVCLLPHFFRVITFITLIYSIWQDIPGRGATICNCFFQARTQTVPMAKKVAFHARSIGDTSIDKTSSTALQEGLLSSKRRETANWFASLKPSCTDAFSHDSDLMKEARSHYFATHPWDWTDGNTDNLSNIFRELAEGADLLGKSIHELQLSWEGPEELKHANYSLHSLPKGLKFLRAVPTLESPNIMGLKGIHDADALWHFSSYTYCPWCGKEGQNGGTVVNHLRTVHYKLGIVCNLCYSCPTVMSDTLCWHGCHNCHQ